MWIKKRKDAESLHDLADQDEHSSASRCVKRRHAVETLAKGGQNGLPTDSVNGKFTNRSLSTKLPKESAQGNSALLPDRNRTESPRFRSISERTQTKASLSASAQNVAASMNRNFATPKSTRPFKPPSSVGSSVDPSTPSVLPRKSLGASRPVSLIARRSLQLDWVKFTETSQQATPPPHDVEKASKDSRQEKATRRTCMMRMLHQQNQPEIVPVNQKRRDGEEGDTSSWILD